MIAHIFSQSHRSSTVSPGEARQTGRLAQGVPYGDVLLAVSAELGPQLDDRGVVVEDAAFGEHVDHRPATPLPIESLKNRVSDVTGRPVVGSATPATASITVAVGVTATCRPLSAPD